MEENHYCNEFLNYLKNNKPIHFAMVNHTDEFRGLDMRNTYKLLAGYNLILKENKTYHLDNKALHLFENTPIEFINKPYDYFLDLEKRKAHDESSKKWYERENAKTQFENFAKIEGRAKRSECYAILAIVVSAIAIVLPMICNTHD